ncbi:MAG: T9SS type A sorting domain-containing protein [Bacteroidetes bacterium]|nr:T9SS type A sorting domain-containing protein [Bacteroidota bacterium]
MSKKLTLIIALVSMVSSLLAQYNVVNATHYSPSLNQEKPVKIYLPPNYYIDTTEHYPVIYFLHGANNDQTSYPGMISWTQSLINSGAIHPVIVVFANGACPPYWGSMYTNSALYGNYEDYIVFDLVAFIDTTFRTLAEREFRCITGHSMGGGGSAKLAIKHPEIYRGFASHAGIMNFDTLMSIWQPLIFQENGGVPPYNYTWDAGTYTNFFFTGAGAMSPNLNNPPTNVDYPLDPDGNVIDSIFVKWKQHDNCCLVKQISPADNLGIFFSCGTEDDHQLYPTNELFRDTLDMLGLEYVFLTTGGDHSLSGEMIQAGMKFLDSLMYIDVGMNKQIPLFNSSVHNLSFYPNPVVSELTISYELAVKDFVTVKVLDMTGSNIFSTTSECQIGENKQVLDFSGLFTGIYFCRVQIGNERITKKIIKIK